MRLLLLLAEQSEQGGLRHAHHLETHSGNISHGVSRTTESSNQHLVVLIHVVQATIARFKQPSRGTKAVIFLPFLISCTRTHLRMAELGCLASTPLGITPHLQTRTPSQGQFPWPWWLLRARWPWWKRCCVPSCTSTPSDAISKKIPYRPSAPGDGQHATCEQHEYHKVF